ncbi:MAG: PAS domain S-box protein [Myxococcales bacterium]|nr:MAG: PAS domain S-box protein [Myxococcales bacterium]
MSELAALLEGQAETLLERWVERVRQGVAPGGESGVELRDHVPLVLRDLALALRAGQPAGGREHTEEHGRQRYRIGFDVEMVMREYGLLRNVILDAAEAQGLALTMGEVRVLGDFLTRAMTDGVTEHNRQRVHEESARASASLQAIREREVRLATTLSSIGDAVISTDAQGHITFMNPVARELTGWTEADAYGQPMAVVFRILNEHTRLPVDSPVDRVLREGVVVGLANHTLLVRRDGTEIPIDDSAAPIRDLTGGLTGVVLVFRDVSEKKRAEAEREALLALERASRAEAESERQKQHALFMQAPVAIAILEGPAHHFTFANPAYRALVGGRDVVGKPLHEALPDVKEMGFDRLLDQVMTTGETYVAREMPIRLEHHVGDEVLILNFVYMAKRNAAGVIDGVLMTGWEVTEQVRARQRVELLAADVRASEERYRTLFASIDDAFCLIELIVDERGQTRDYLFLEANAAFEVQTGLKEPVGKTIVEMVPDISTTWFDIYGRIVATGETQRFENHDPALHRWFDAYASRVEPASKRQVAIVFKDITARRRAELERERLLGELARSNTALDQFAYVASHDLKAPLRGIANLSHWIEDDLGDAVTDDARDKLGLLRGRVQRLEDLINGILDYSTAGRSQAKPEPVDTGKLLADVIELLAPPEHIALTVADVMPTIVAEKVPLQQVFMNLIGNAVKYSTQPGATVRIASTDEDAAVHFTVTDNGPGIAPEHHERIWGIFQKLGSKVDGTGIGLSVVKRIVESRGGRVWVESQPGAGATFHVVWPRQGPESG